MATFVLQTDIDLSKLTTMKIGGKAKYYTEIINSGQLKEVLSWTTEQKIPFYILGGGSNTVFDDGFFDGLIILINIKGIEKVSENHESAIVRVGAGEDWDETVKQIVDMNLWGMEALSGIPGKTGAAPYQNIGAYGQELKDTVDHIEAFDTLNGKISELSNAECNFGYRDSIFKSSEKGRYIITNVFFKLSKKPLGVPNYKDVVKYFEDKKVSEPTIKQIREAIIEIRKSKFVDPSVMPNSGSFFKNPTVDAPTAERLMKKFPEVRPYPEDNKIFPVEKNCYKIAAGWLLQELGYKGKDFGKIRIDPNHALVVENQDGATQKDLVEVITKIRADVKKNFGIDLEPEPVIVKFKDLEIK